MSARDTLRREISLYDPGNGIAVDLLAIDELLRDFLDAHERNAYPGHYTKLIERARALGYGEK